MGHRAADPSDRRDELGDGVLGGDGVVEDGRVEGSAVLCLEHTGRLHDSPDGLEDPLWPFRLAKAGAPVGEHGEVEARVVEREPTGDLPVEAGPQLSDGVAVGQTLQGLEHHHRADEHGWDRRSALPGGEQVGKVLVFEQLVSVIGQERVDRALFDEAPAEGGGVEHLAVWVGFSLHKPILLCGRRNREHSQGRSKPLKTTAP